MSDNYDRDEATRAAAIAHWGFDVPLVFRGQDEVPFEDRVEAGMENADAHHECPEKRVKGWCGHAVHD